MINWLEIVPQACLSGHVKRYSSKILEKKALFLPDKSHLLLKTVEKCIK